MLIRSILPDRIDLSGKNDQADHARVQESGKEICVADYFQKAYHDLRYPHLPCAACNRPPFSIEYPRCRLPP